MCLVRTVNVLSALVEYYMSVLGITHYCMPCHIFTRDLASLRGLLWIFVKRFKQPNADLNICFGNYPRGKWSIGRFSSLPFLLCALLSGKFS